MKSSRNRLLALGALMLAGLYFFWPQSTTCASFARFGAELQGERCVVADDLTLEGDVDGLPPNLVVQGNLTINGTNIGTLPVGLVVDGNLDLYKTSIGALPENLVVGGDFTNYLGFGSPDIFCAEIPVSVVIRGQNLGCSS
jgi:hypothetical protein